MGSSNILNYTNYDFDSMVVQLQNIIATKDTWTDLYESGTGKTLLEMFAYAMEMNQYYLERRAEENYLPTAKVRSSVENLVSLLNYNATRTISSTGTVTFTIASAHTLDIPIPAYTRIKGADYEYITTSDVTLKAGDTSIDVGIEQGKRIVETWVSPGTIDAVYKITSLKVENTSLAVSVDSVAWTKVSSFVNYGASDTVYTENFLFDGGIRITFGDSKFGKVPEVGKTITFSYIESDGENGNVTASAVITEIISSLVDADGDAVTLTVTNASSVLGGENEESIDDIKYNAPRVFATGDRAVTKADYKALLLLRSKVESAIVWGEQEEDSPNQDMYNVVKICMILQEWEIPDTEYESDTTIYLADYKTVTVRLSYVDPTIVNIVPVVTIYAERSAVLNTVTALVNTQLATTFALGRDTLGTDIRHSDVVKSIDSLAGVSYHYIVFDIRKDLTLQSGSYIATLDLTTVKVSTVRIYDSNDTLMASDDGLGNLIDSGGSGSGQVVGSVNYSTGALTFSGTVVSGVTSGAVYYCRYQQDENGDLVTDKNEALKLYETEVSTSYISL